MSRIPVRVAVATLIALFGLAGKAAAQAGCQPTITQPCTKPPGNTSNQPAARKNSAASDDSTEPKDHSPRLKLDPDTEFKFGTGGIGIGRKF